MARRIALVLCLLAGFATAVAASPVSDQQAAIENILKLVQRGVSDQVIIRHIQAQHYVFDLSTEDILSLRDEGVNDAVLTAMLDTAIEGDTAGRDDGNQGVATESESTADAAEVTSEDTSQSTVILSAGYFSPWYRYPYAWGFYYDPFPTWYSTYYYPPFYYSYDWGWYGGCNYWYAGWWPHYRWNDPYYYNYAHAHHGHWVPVPHYGDAHHWDSGRGLANHRGAPGQRVGAYDSARRGAPVASPRSGMRARQLEGRAAAPRVHVRSPGHEASPAGSPTSRSRGSAPVSGPSPGPRYSAPRGGGREGAPAATPRPSAPRVDSGGRGSAPAQAPHVAPPSSGGGLRPAPSLRVPQSAPAPRSAAPAAPPGGASRLRF
jgi:hypothetical protein